MQQAKSRIQEIIFGFFKIEDKDIRNRILAATETGYAESDFTFKQMMAHALLTVFYESPGFFLLGCFCLTFILPTIILINIFG